MTADYRIIWGAAGGTFLKDGSVDEDSIEASIDYREVLHMLGCKVDEDCTDYIKHLSINMKANDIEIPSCEINFAVYSGGGTNGRDNPARVETAILHAIEKYGRIINSDPAYITQDIAIIWMNFGTEDDAKRFYGLVTEEYSELNKMWDNINNKL